MVVSLDGATDAELPSGMLSESLPSIAPAVAVVSSTADQSMETVPEADGVESLSVPPLPDAAPLNE